MQYQTQFVQRPQLRNQNKSSNYSLSLFVAKLWESSEHFSQLPKYQINGCYANIWRVKRAQD